MLLPQPPKTMKRTATLLVLSALSALLALAPATQPGNDDVPRPVEDAAKFRLQPKPDPSLPTLFLVGDSTMKVGTAGQRGWGEELAPFFDKSKINVLNQAIGGRSSRTYQTEGRWDALLPMIQKGDFVIIQFGHNDAGAINDNSRARATIKGTGEETLAIDNILTKKHETVHSYGWYIRKYIRDVKAKGATAIVMSLTPRNTWTDGKVARSTPNNYGQWARLVAESEAVTFVDHNDIIATEMEKLGQEQSAPLYADQKLHTSPQGAAFNAKAAIEGLRAIKGAPLDQYLSDAGQKIPAFASSPK